MVVILQHIIMILMITNLETILEQRVLQSIGLQAGSATIKGGNLTLASKSWCRK